MPLRLPLPRRMGPTTPPPFRRRTPPTPQATRLMKISLGAGIVFLVVLGAVFIPVGLRYGEVDRPSVVLATSGAGPFVVEVTRASRAHPLSAYRAELNATNGSARVDVDIPRLDGSGPWGDGVVAFSDADGDEVLSVGDAFMIQAQPASDRPWTYTLLIFFIPSDAGATRPCPCAVGRIAFTA